LEPTLSSTIWISGNYTALGPAAANLSRAEKVRVDRAISGGGKATHVPPDISPGLVRVWLINGTRTETRTGWF
jgi:hypothetical protein